MANLGERAGGGTQARLVAWQLGWSQLEHLPQAMALRAGHLANTSNGKRLYLAQQAVL
jgi:hypothetical protein